MAGSIGVSFLIGATLGSSVGAAFSTLQDRIKATQQSFRNASRQSRQLSDAVLARQKRDAALELAQKQKSETGHVEAGLRKHLQRLQLAYVETAKKAGVYGQSVEEIIRRQQEMARGVETTKARLDRLQGLQNQRNVRSEVFSQMRDTLAPAAAVAMPVKLAIDFESAMADVKKVTDFDAPGFEKFSGDMLELSTRLPMAADGLAAIAAAAGQSGIAKEELLTFTEDAAKMGVAFDISAAEAGSAMTGLRNNFKLSQDGVRLLGDSMNALANSMDAKASAIVNFANRAGGTAKTYGMTGQEVAALGAAFLDAKVGVEEASTATNTMLVNLGTASKLPKAAQAGFKSLGLSASALEKAFKEDAQGALLGFLQVVKKSKDPMGALTDIFGKEHAPKIVRLMNNLDHYQEALKTVSDKGNYANSMDEEYAVRAKTTANNIQLLKNTVNKLGITVGSVLLPPLNKALDFISPIISGVADFAKQNEGLTQSVALAAGGFLAFRIGGLALKFILSGARSGCLQLGGALKTVGGAMRATGRAFLIPWNFKAKAAAVVQGCGSIKRSLQSIGRNAASAARRLRTLGPAGMKAAAGAAGLKMLGGGVKLLGRGVKTLGRAFAVAFGPVSILMMALSYGADYVIENWDKIGPYFTALWDGVKNVFNSVLAWMKPIIDKIVGMVRPVADTVGNVASFVGKGLSTVKNWVFGGDDKEKAEAETDKNGQPDASIAPKSVAAAMPQPAANAAPKPVDKSLQKSLSPEQSESAAQSAMPKPAGKAVPTKEEAKEKAAQMRVEQAAPESQKPKSEKARKFEEVMALNQATQAPAPDEVWPAQKAEKPKNAKNQATLQTQIVQPQVQVAVNVTQNGVPDQTFATGVMNAIRARQSELEAMISEIVNNQARLAYGG